MATFAPSVDLRGAEFIDVDLRGARFVEANLSGVVMRGVQVEGAVSPPEAEVRGGVTPMIY